jgi:enolase
LNGRTATTAADRSNKQTNKQTNKRQAYELRDGGDRYMGKGVLKAVGNVNSIIAPKLVGKDETAQAEIDKVCVGGGVSGREDGWSDGANGWAWSPSRLIKWTDDMAWRPPST